MIRKLLLGLAAVQILGWGSCLSTGCAATRSAGKHSYVLGSSAHPIMLYEVKTEQDVLTDRFECDPWAAPLWVIEGTVQVVKQSIDHVSE